MFRRSLIFVVFVGVLALLFVLLREHLTWQTVVEEESRLRGWLSGHPWRGLGIGFVIYIVVSLIPGTTGKAIVVGWLYGFWQGLLLVNVGLTLAAMLSFFVSRYVFRDAVASRSNRRMAHVNGVLEREGPGYLFAARVLHVPFSLTNYVMGATRIPALGFWWTTQLGILPGNILFVYAGAQAPTLETFAREGLSPLLSPGLIAAFVAVSVIPLLLKIAVNRMRPLVRHRRGDGGRSRFPAGRASADRSTPSKEGDRCNGEGPSSSRTCTRASAGSCS